MGSYELMYKTDTKKEAKILTNIAYCYHNVWRDISKWEAIEKSPIFPLQYWKINFGSTKNRDSDPTEIVIKLITVKLLTTLLIIR